MRRGPIQPADSAFQILADLIHERTGLIYENSRADLLSDRLALLMSESGFDAYLDYYYYLKYDEKAEGEWRRVQHALAVNETYFWREYDQIRAAVEEIVPRLQRERPGQPVRIWHAACATGEEPYTMAIALTEAGCYLRGPVEITATDFNEAALEQACKGIYRQRSFRSIPLDIWRRYFQPSGVEQYQLVDAIRERVDFRYMNLLDETSMTGMRNYDIILCRNAFIYFSSPAIQRVVRHFYQALNPDSYLFVSAAESLLRITNQFELVEVGDAFGYQKRSAANSLTFGEQHG